MKRISEPPTHTPKSPLKRGLKWCVYSLEGTRRKNPLYRGVPRRDGVCSFWRGVTQRIELCPFYRPVLSLAEGGVSSRDGVCYCILPTVLLLMF